jgi:putative endonuclease
MATKDIGDRGEMLAAAYLEAKGYQVLEKNYRFERAEVDLVCFLPSEPYDRGGELVFVEVKTRTGSGFGRPEEAVNREKQLNVMRAAEAYLYERRLDGSPCRFDVIGIVLRGDEPHIEHFENAFGLFP